MCSNGQGLGKAEEDAALSRKDYHVAQDEGWEVGRLAANNV